MGGSPTPDSRSRVQHATPAGSCPSRDYVRCRFGSYHPEPPAAVPRPRCAICRLLLCYGPGRDRTCGLGIKSPLLYQLSYRPVRPSVRSHASSSCSTLRRCSSVNSKWSTSLRASAGSSFSTAASRRSRTGVGSRSCRRSQRKRLTCVASIWAVTGSNRRPLLVSPDRTSAGVATSWHRQQYGCFRDGSAGRRSPSVASVGFQEVSNGSLHCGPGAILVLPAVEQVGVHVERDARLLVTELAG